MCRSGALSLNRTSSLPRCLSHNSRRLYQFGHRSHPFTDTGHDGNRPILQLDSLVFGAAVHRRCQVRQVRAKANQFAPLETGRLLRTGTNDGSNSCPAVQHPSDARAVVHRTEARWIESLRSCSRCHAAASAAFLSPARRSGGEHLLPRTREGGSRAFVAVPHLFRGIFIQTAGATAPGWRTLSRCRPRYGGVHGASNSCRLYPARYDDNRLAGDTATTRGIDAGKWCFNTDRPCLSLSKTQTRTYW
jgi:hypothetical protein